MGFDLVEATLTAVLILASAVWLGGMVTIFVVARVATRTLPPASRVAFFRGLGRLHGVIGSVALVVAFGSGGALLHERAWDGLMAGTVAVAAGLACLTIVAIAQARAMTRLRDALLRDPSDDRLSAQVHQGARRAAVLRAAIGVCSVALVALGATLST